MSLNNQEFVKKLPDWASQENLCKLQVRTACRHAMFAMDVDGNLLSWNEGVREILGYSEEEWIGQHASIIFMPRDQAREVCVSEMKIAAEQGYANDIRWHARKDGAELFAHGFMTALRADDGTLLGYSKILSDETKNKELQDALTESNEALEQFAYVASHDLQEPLRTVGAYTELLGRRYGDKLGAEGAEFLDVIVKGARRMSALVDNLLTFARVQTEIDRPGSYSLDQDVETALTQLEKSIEETGAVVTHDPLPTVEADQGQMVRLFQNLIGNALKYRKPDTPPVIHISSEPRDSGYVVSVRDNGIGFDPKYAKEIFSPFKRLHGQGEYSGTGIGLAICRRVVERHGGRIWAESQPGQGSTFYFFLPFAGKTTSRYTPPVTQGL